jgi:hypothetical protein
VSHQRFLVEFDRRSVGVAVRVPGGFMFFSSSDQFDQLDGKLFRRARALERQLAKIAAVRRRSPQQRLSAI